MENQNDISFAQTVAILIDGNNIEKSMKKIMRNNNAVINFDVLIPKLVGKRSLNRLIYFREGSHISDKLADRIHSKFYGVVRPCYKTADIPLSIEAVKLAEKVDVVIIASGDADFVDLVKYLKPRGVRVEVACAKDSGAYYLIKEADYNYVITEEDGYIINQQKIKFDSTPATEPTTGQ